MSAISRNSLIREVRLTVAPENDAVSVQVFNRDGKCTHIFERDTDLWLMLWCRILAGIIAAIK